MKNKKIAVYLYMSLLLATMGCSKSNADSDVLTVETINFNDVIDANTEESNTTQSRADYEQPQPDISQLQADNEQLQSNSELDGTIESIGDNRVVINKTFHLSEDTAVSYAASDETLITVFFSEETSFEVWTVKNSGVNGDSDIDKQKGSFSDLEQGTSINMTGNYDGNDFHAKHVIIYNFV